MSVRGRRSVAAAARRTGACVCHKIGYFTVAAARRAKLGAAVRDEGRMRVYACPNQSRTWHITHQAPLSENREGVEE